MICTHLRLLFSIIGLILLYYLDILTDIAVLRNYYIAHENGIFVISCFAIFSGLVAQILYSPLLSIYRNNCEKKRETTLCISTIVRLLLSILYLTPLYLLYKFLYILCFKLSKNLSDEELQLGELQLQSIDMDIDSFEFEQQKQDQNMMVYSLDKNILTSKHKCNLLNNIKNDILRYSFIKSCFQSSINIFVQIFVLGEFYLLREETRKATKEIIALSENDILLFPDNRSPNEIYLLFISVIISFICLCNASWSQISDVILTSPQSQLNYCIPLLFKLRAILESNVRILRFMIISVVFGAIYGCIIIILEVICKYVLLMLLYPNKCNIELHKSVASLMIFSKEISKKNPCLIRFIDIVLWTMLLLIATIVSIQIINIGKLNGICNNFLQFQNDCLPLEIIISITILIVLLLIIYLLSPSIFNLISSFDNEITDITNKQKYINFNQLNESDHDITIIDISKPIQNPPIMPKNPKRKYKNSNNLMLLNIDEQINNKY